MLPTPPMNRMQVMMRCFMMFSWSETLSGPDSTGDSFLVVQDALLPCHDRRRSIEKSEVGVNVGRESLVCAGCSREFSDSGLPGFQIDIFPAIA